MFFTKGTHSTTTGLRLNLVRGVLDGEQRDPAHLGAVPIACPILAGPGAMMTVLVTHSRDGLLVAAAIAFKLHFAG